MLLKEIYKYVTNKVDRISALEKENRILKDRLEKAQIEISNTQKLNSFFAYGGEVVFYVLNDRKKTIINVSEGITLYGYSPDEMIAGQYSMEDLVYPDNFFIPELTGPDIEIKYQVTNNITGIHEWVAFTIIPEKKASGETTHFLIRSRKMQEEENQAPDNPEPVMSLEQMVKSISQNRLVSLSNNLPGGVIFQMMGKRMRNTKLTYISAYFADMFELSVEEVLANNTLLYRTIHPEDWPSVVEHYINADKQGVIDIEYRIFTRSGACKWIHTRSSHHFVGTMRVWDGFMIDITSRKLAEQELEKTRRKQGILIKVLQIIQSADNIPDAINIALGEIGRYIEVSRVYIFENQVERNTVNNTYEWCNNGIFPAIDTLQDLPMSVLQHWYDTFYRGEYICTPDIRTLTPADIDLLSAQGISSILVIPLTSEGIHYGFVGFDDCTSHRNWEQSEIDILVSLSQIVSTAIKRYHAEKTIRLSQQTMHTVLDNINASIYVVDFEYRKILFANKKVKDDLGYDIEGKLCWEVLQKNQSGPCSFCPRHHLLDENHRPTGSYCWEHWNGHVERWYECTDTAIEWIDGRLVHMEYATDITNRKLSDVKLSQSEEMYRRLTEASPDAVVVCSPNREVQFISSKTLEMFGMDKNTDVRDINIWHYVHPHDRNSANELFEMKLQNQSKHLPQLLLIRQDGSEFFGELSSATVQDSDGEISAIIIIIRDITQRKMSELELIRAKEKAEESDKLKSAFLANMSHEIRTPLNGIIGFLNLLISNEFSSEKMKGYVDMINNCSIQLVKLIDDILDLAKIRSKQMHVYPTPYKINDLMYELKGFFETHLEVNGKSHIELILDDSQFIDSCVTYIDPMRLRQILNNLINNAIKFTEKGYIRFGYRQSASGTLEFMIDDSGIGLAPDHKEVIFEQFRQAELGNNRIYGGTGLGLAISRSLVQLMGGDIRVESEEGLGSSFYVTIPYLPVTAENIHLFDEIIETLLPVGPFAGKAILLAEPDIIKYQYYASLLSRTSASVIHADTLQEWLDQINRTNVDMVIADVTVFDTMDHRVMEQLKVVRTGLPTVLITPEKPDRYAGIIKSMQYDLILEEPVRNTQLITTMEKYIWDRNHQP